MSETLLSPGQLIRPIVSQEAAIEIVERVYGLKVSKITELNAYDDKNYHIFCKESEFSNPNIGAVSSAGYVLKIINSLDSKKTDVIQAHTEMMLFLNRKEICCPLPVKCIDGSYFSLQSLKADSCKNHVVRLLVYRPGKLLIRVKKTEELMKKLGKYVAMISKTLKEFSHSGYDNHQTIWMLHSVPKIREFLYVLEDDKRHFISEVIIAFEEKVLRCIDRFEEGFIHGDLNEQNIVMCDDEKTIGAVIDFGDSQRSYLIFELTIALTYMLLQTEDLVTGKFVIRGYESVRPLSDKEKSIIKICVCARLSQSLVLGLYSYKNDTGNEYLLTTQKPGWKLLSQLWSMSDNDVSQIWDIN